MGATTFHDTASVKAYPKVKAAFDAVVEEARHESGHRPYSGTISGKPGFSLFPATGRSLDLVLPATVDEALFGDEDAVKLLLQHYPSLMTELPGAQGLYDDKYAPAIAFLHGETWHFVGWTPE